MATHPKVWTADMLDDAPDDGRRWEVINGRLLVTPGPDTPHQLAAGEFFVRLSVYFGRTAQARVVMSPSDIRSGPLTRMQPDIYVVAFCDGKLPAAPFDLAELLLTIEVISPSSARPDRHIRRAAYLEGGVPECWIVDPKKRHIERWRTGDTQPEIVTDEIMFQAPGIDHPLIISLPELFADAFYGL
ncbi:MAG: Uma2 family endonuclease [Gemmatimonadaceae bacterium]|nr:Uma2 family endonuclease [Gemmatimonadaceae bacterium]